MNRVSQTPGILGLTLEFWNCQWEGRPITTAYSTFQGSFVVVVVDIVVPSA